MSPEISVLMAVCNEKEEFLKQALDSILKQTYTGFEFIIIDDGSSNHIQELLNRYNDPRIILIRNQTNLGLTKSLNIGLNVAKSKYIARLDSDDIAMPDRLKRQHEFLTRHRDIAAVGSWYIGINSVGHKIKTGTPVFESHMIRWRLLFKNTFIHSSIMYKKILAQRIGGYDESFSSSQDYDLWSRLNLNWETVNIPERLIKLRIHENSISSKNKSEQLDNLKKISKRNIEKILDKKISKTAFVQLSSTYLKENLNNLFFDITALDRDFEKLLRIFLKKYCYTNKSIIQDLKADIAYHIFLAILRSSVITPSRIKSAIKWIALNSNSLFHSFFYIIFKRTLLYGLINKTND